MDDGNTIKKYFRQAALKKIVRYFAFGAGIGLLVSSVLTGCSLFSGGSSDGTDATSTEEEGAINGKGSITSLKDGGSEVSVKPLVDPKKLTDVNLQFSLTPGAPVESLIFHFGKSPDSLTSSKKVSKESLTLIDSTTGTYRYTIKDVGEIRPLFISITTEAGGMKSEPSQPFEVKD